MLFVNFCYVPKSRPHTVAKPCGFIQIQQTKVNYIKLPVINYPDTDNRKKIDHVLFLGIDIYR